MGEVITSPGMQPSVGPEQQAIDGSLSYRERLRQGLGRMVEGGLSFIDLAAGVALARDDLRLTRRAMQRLDEPYGGIIERQTSADRLPMQLESDIILDFRRALQQAGYDDVNDASTAERSAIAARIIGDKQGDVAAALTQMHPEWSVDEVMEAAATRAADIAVLFGMDAEGREQYLAAQRDYLSLKNAIPEIQSELSELRAERSQRLSRIGRVAVGGVVGVMGGVRNLPRALSARAMIMGMSFSERMHSAHPEKRQRLLLGTAAGVAIAGIASYVAMRSGLGHTSGSGAYALTGSNTPLLPSHVGSSLPTYVGSSTPSHLGSYALPAQSGGGVQILPSQVGGAGELPSHLGGGSTPNHVGSSLPNHVGSAYPSSVGGGGSPTPNHVGTGSVPNQVGSSLPNYLGSNRSITSSNELFSTSGRIDTWPATITISHWDPRDLDGSLSGISRQMLIRSGIPNPTSFQINTLVGSLKPQAQPNGYLVYGQKLDLLPAAKALKSILGN